MYKYKLVIELLFGCPCRPPLGPGLPTIPSLGYSTAASSAKAHLQSTAQPWRRLPEIQQALRRLPWRPEIQPLRGVSWRTMRLRSRRRRHQRKYRAPVRFLRRLVRVCGRLAVHFVVRNPFRVPFQFRLRLQLRWRRWWRVKRFVLYKLVQKRSDLYVYMNR